MKVKLPTNGTVEIHEQKPEYYQILERGYGSNQDTVVWETETKSEAKETLALMKEDGYTRRYIHPVYAKEARELENRYANMRACKEMGEL